MPASETASPLNQGIFSGMSPAEALRPLPEFSFLPKEKPKHYLTGVFQ